MTTLTKLQSVLGGIYTLESAIMPSWFAKSLFTGQIALGCEYIVPQFLKDITLYTSVGAEKAIIGEDITDVLNKGIEHYFSFSKFIAQQTNKGVYKVATVIDNQLEISASIINKVSEFGAYTYESLSNTISAGYEYGTDFYEDFNSTAVESIKSGLELDLVDNQQYLDLGTMMCGIS